MKNHDLNVFLYDSSASIGNSYHECAAERSAGMYLSVHPGMFISMFRYLKQLQRSKATAAADKISRCRSVFFQPCAAKRQKYTGKVRHQPVFACMLSGVRVQFLFSDFLNSFWPNQRKNQNGHIQQFHSDISFIQDNIQHFLFLNSHFCVCVTVQCPSVVFIS